MKFSEKKKKKMLKNYLIAGGIIASQAIAPLQVALAVESDGGNVQTELSPALELNNQQNDNAKEEVIVDSNDDAKEEEVVSNDEVANDDDSKEEQVDNDEVAFRKLDLKGESVLVSTFEEFQAAMTVATVSDITLDSNITLRNNVTANGLEKRIHGEGHIIHASQFNVEQKTARSVSEVENVKIVNTDSNGILWSKANNVTVKYKNVEHQGARMMNLPSGSFILEGNVSSYSHTFEVFTGLELIIAENSNVNLVDISNIYPAIRLATNGNMLVEKGANVAIEAGNNSVRSGTNVNFTNKGNISFITTNDRTIILEIGSQMDLQSGSMTKVTSKDKTYEAILVVDGSLNLDSDASLEAYSDSTHGTIITGNKMVFAKGSNFSITNNSKTGVIFGSYRPITNVVLNSNTGINTWNKGEAGYPIPDKVYSGDLESSFTLHGYTAGVIQANMQSTNPDFNNNFITKNVSRITGGSYTIPTGEAMLEASDGSVEYGSEWNDTVAKEVAHVKATDKDGNDETDKVTVSGNVDTEKIGDYPVTFTSPSGLTKEVTITVKEKELDTALTAETFVIGRDTYVVGTAGTDVKFVELQVNGKYAKRTSVVDGKYRVYGMAIASKNDEVKIVGLDGNKQGFTPEASTEVHVEEKEEENSKLTANDYELGTPNITGTYDNDKADRIKLLVDGKVVKQVIFESAESDQYSIYAEKYVTSTTQRVEIGQYTGSTLLNKVEVPVKEKEVVEYAITANDYFLGASHLTGTWIGDNESTNVALLKDGKIAKIGGLETDGTYSLFVEGFINSPQDDVKVVLYNKASKKILAENDISIIAEVTADPFEIGVDGYVTGFYDSTNTKDRDTIKILENNVAKKLVHLPALPEEEQSIKTAYRIAAKDVIKDKNQSYSIQHLKDGKVMSEAPIKLK